MALTPHEAVQLADLLPDGMRCDDARQRLLCVVQLLQALTDADHLLSNADIRAILQARFGQDCAPSENTVAADLHAIESSGCLGITLHVEPRGVWCEREGLSPAKVRMMLNAVQASRFLTTEQSAELQEELFGLVSRHQEDDLAGEVHVDQRVRKSYQQVFDTIDAVSRAIHTRKKIEFHYSYTDFRSRPQLLSGDNGSTLRVETPIALYFSEDNYYVETYTPTPWRHGIEVMFSRADRMVGTRVSDEDAETSRKVYDLRRSARKRMRESFDMISGPVRHVFLRVRSDATNLLYDRFGFGLRFGLFEEREGGPSRTAVTLLRIPEAPGFYRWLASAGGKIVLSEPPSELVLSSDPWARELRGVSREQLVEDYECMLRRYLDFLDRARAPYLQEE